MRLRSTGRVAGGVATRRSMSPARPKPAPALDSWCAAVSAVYKPRGTNPTRHKLRCSPAVIRRGACCRPCRPRDNHKRPSAPGHSADLGQNVVWPKMNGDSDPSRRRRRSSLQVSSVSKGLAAATRNKPRDPDFLLSLARTRAENTRSGLKMGGRRLAAGNLGGPKRRCARGCAA